MKLAVLTSIKHSRTLILSNPSTEGVVQLSKKTASLSDKLADRQVKAHTCICI